ncbi:MAG: SIS domain-containing protein [Candidatus Pacearchaeota archaeon]
MDRNETEELIRSYFDEKKDALSRLPISRLTDAADLVWRAYENKGTIYGCGNGGNAGAVSNLLNDLGTHTFVTDDKTKPLPRDVPRLRCLDLCTNTTAITAFLNDFGSYYIFSKQLETYRVGENDIIFGYSGSGSSRNIIEAFETVKGAGGKTVAVSRNPEGAIVKIADVPVVFTFGRPSEFPGQQASNDNNFHYEGFGFDLGHVITGIMRKRVMEKYL